MRRKTAEEAAEDNKMQKPTGGTEDSVPPVLPCEAFSPLPQVLPRARPFHLCRRFCRAQGLFTSAAGVAVCEAFSPLPAGVAARMGLYQISCMKVPLFRLHMRSHRPPWVSAGPEPDKIPSKFDFTGIFPPGIGYRPNHKYQ